MAIEYLQPTDGAARLAEDAPPLIIDVREPWEYGLAHIEPSELIPLSELPDRVHTLDPTRPYALLCHHGMRSEMAANWLAQQGFQHLVNIEGGIDAWSMHVNPDSPRY